MIKSTPVQYNKLFENVDGGGLIKEWYTIVGVGRSESAGQTGLWDLFTLKHNFVWF